MIDRGTYAEEMDDRDPIKPRCSYCNDTREELCGDVWRPCRCLVVMDAPTDRHWKEIELAGKNLTNAVKEYMLLVQRNFYKLTPSGECNQVIDENKVEAVFNIITKHRHYWDAAVEIVEYFARKP